MIRAKTGELSLEEIKELIDKIKSELASKQGEMAAEMKSLQKDYGVKNLEAAYALLKELNHKVEGLAQERATLMAKVTEQLQKYGYK